MFCFRAATASQASWRSEDVVAAEEVRALADLVGKTYFP